MAQKGSFENKPRQIIVFLFNSHQWHGYRLFCSFTSTVLLEKLFKFLQSQIDSNDSIGVNFMRLFMEEFQHWSNEKSGLYLPVTIEQQLTLLEIHTHVSWTINCSICLSRSFWYCNKYYYKTENVSKPLRS